MADVAEEMVAEGAEIVWVLEQGPQFQPGTAELCMDVMDALGAPTVGWCVGDDETLPTPGTFDDSPFSVARGFDMIVPRRTMEVAYTTSHGSVGGNDNPSGEEVLQALRDVLSQL